MKIVFATNNQHKLLLRHVVSLLAHRPEGVVVPGGLLYVLRKLSSSLGMFCTHSPADSICTT